MMRLEMKASSYVRLVVVYSVAEVFHVVGHNWRGIDTVRSCDTIKKDFLGSTLIDLEIDDSNSFTDTQSVGENRKVFRKAID